MVVRADFTQQSNSTLSGTFSKGNENKEVKRKQIFIIIIVIQFVSTTKQLVRVDGRATVAGVVSLSLDFRPSDGLCLAIVSAEELVGTYDRADVRLSRAVDACVRLSGTPQQISSLVVVCLSVENPECVVGEQVTPSALTSESGVLFGLSAMIVGIIGAGVCCFLLCCAALIFFVARRTGGNSDSDNSVPLSSFDPVLTGAQPHYGSSLPVASGGSYQDLSMRDDSLSARPAAALPFGAGGTLQSQGSEFQRNNQHYQAPSQDQFGNNVFPSGVSSDQYKPVLRFA